MELPLIDRWIESFLSERPLRANSIIITIYGDFIAPHGGTAWLGSFIKLVAPLGLNPRMVRTSVFRLSRDKWLSAEQIGRRSYYSLTTTGRRRFEHAFRRIYYEPTKQWDGTWLIVLTTTGDIPEAQREALRRELLWDGFGAIAPGVLAHPSVNPDVLSDILEGTGAAGRIVVMRARNLEPVATGALNDLVRQCWNLDAIAHDYHCFVGRFHPLLQAMEGVAERDPRQCFVVRTLLLHEFRRVLLRDPQLPPRLLPADWPGAAARRLCRGLYLATQHEAERHVMAVLETPSGRLPDAAPYFYERFGGFSANSMQATQLTAA